MCLYYILKNTTLLLSDLEKKENCNPMYLLHCIPLICKCAINVLSCEIGILTMILIDTVSHIDVHPLLSYV